MPTIFIHIVSIINTALSICGIHINTLNGANTMIFILISTIGLWVVYDTIKTIGKMFKH